jgi:tetratricopeptide (TPR) repeat protein
VADSPRIQELRRRVQQDPASPAFAPLAEELRRAGRPQEAIAACRAGLQFQPAYVSARATLGRALLDVGELDEALVEFHTVLAAAPEHLSALRGIGEVHQRSGRLEEALAAFRQALALAREDPDISRAVSSLDARLRPAEAVATVAAPAAGPPSRGRLRRLERFLAAILADRARRR